MRIFLLLILAVAVHMLLGWIPAVLVGVLAGYWVRTWWAGTLVLGGSWVALVGYNLFVDATAMLAMSDVVGGLLGDLPGGVVFTASVLVGVVLGSLAGYVGLQARALSGARSAYG